MNLTTTTKPHRLRWVVRDNGPPVLEENVALVEPPIWKPVSVVTFTTEPTGRTLDAQWKPVLNALRNMGASVVHAASVVDDLIDTGLDADAVMHALGDYGGDPDAASIYDYVKGRRGEVAQRIRPDATEQAPRDAVLTPAGTIEPNTPELSSDDATGDDTADDVVDEVAPIEEEFQEEKESEESQE